MDVHQGPGNLLVRVDGRPSGDIELASSITPGRIGRSSALADSGCCCCDAGDDAAEDGELVFIAFFDLV